MGDLLGAAVKFEMGLDVTGTEIGVDLPFHYNADIQTSISRFHSFFWNEYRRLSPVDLTTSRCNARQIAEYQSAVKIHIRHTTYGFVRM